MGDGRSVRAEIIAIGDELLSGETVDTNSSHIDGVLEGHGYAVARHQAVPDDVEAIAEVVRAAAARSDVVVTTGGLGPTRDDRTFEGVARALAVDLVFHPPTWARIEARFAASGRIPTENNRRQAYVPAGAEVLENELGTAPGLAARRGRARIFVLPGVPTEMQWLLDHRVLAQLPAGERLARRTLKVAGIGESQLEAEIAEVPLRHPDVRVGFRTRVFENHVKLFARGPAAEARVEAAASEVRRILGPRIFGEDDDTLEAVVIRVLEAAGATVATAESCTGGWLGKLLTDVPGASAVVRGGIVAYGNAVKVELLGVDLEALERDGAVSEVVAAEMAAGAQSRLGATYGLGTTGVAGPGGGTLEKPVGLVWLALAGPRGIETWRLELGNRTREVIRLATVKSALERLRLVALAGTT